MSGGNVLHPKTKCRPIEKNKICINVPQLKKIGATVFQFNLNDQGQGLGQSGLCSYRWTPTQYVATSLYRDLNVSCGWLLQKACGCR